ncbi:MAG TPA: S-layer homology domain-containing protein [Candidatus Paenibacillus intestinavium]|nr:S-layer homology domain-containing protein [Candidatus Paenibacillus intestinavium]
MKSQFGKKRSYSVFSTVKIALALMLTLGATPILPGAVQVDASELMPQEDTLATSGTPGGIEAGLRLWLKADSGSVTLDGESITEWRDSSLKGNKFVNDGSITEISTRPKPKYLEMNKSTNFQPTVQFVRSGGSILQDIDGIFGSDEELANASVFALAGGISAIDNSMIFDHQLTSGSFSAHLPHKTGSIAGKGSVYWDAGKASGTPRLQAHNEILPSAYNVWGLHFNANPTAGEEVTQTVSRDGMTVGESTAARLPFIGKENGIMSLGSAPAGGSGYNGKLGEFIVFTDPLSETEKRQVDTYLAIKYGLTLAAGDYLSAGPSPQTVWDAAENMDYGYNVAGLGYDELGALNQQQSRSSVGNSEKQLLIGTSQALIDNQYLIWGDDGIDTASTPYFSGFMKLARTWKAQNTGQVGEVHIAIPRSMLPLGGVLLISDDNAFANPTEIVLSETEIHGELYYTANATLNDGAYFTFAEQVPLVQLSSLEVSDGVQQIVLNKAFDPNTTNGYEAVVSQATESVNIALQTDAQTNLYLTNYEKDKEPLLDGNNVALLQGVNKLTIDLTDNGGSEVLNTYQLDVIRKYPISEDGQIQLNGGAVTASSYQPDTNFVPANVVDGIWGEDEASNESRWSASGHGQWLEFDLGEPQKVTYMNIAFLNARERLSSFEMLASNDASFAESVVVLPKRSSRNLAIEDSILQTFVLSEPMTARYYRLVGYGNNASGSSANWNSLMEAQLFIGESPIIEEPEEPVGPPQAGDDDEGALPPPELTKIQVSSAAELQTALDQVVPGTHIEVQNGNYEQNGPFVIFNKQGTAASPIKITAAEQGEVIIVGESYFHIEDSAYIEVSDFIFNNGIGTAAGNQTLVDRGLAHRSLAGVHPGVQLYSSSNVSVLRNVFALDETGQPYSFAAQEGGTVWCLIGIADSCRLGSNYDPDGTVYTGGTPYDTPSLMTTNGTHRHYIRVEGESSHNRLSYNEIGPKKGFGAVVIYDGAGHSGQNISQYDVIEYNHFYGIGPRVSNGLEAIRLGLSSLSLSSGFVTIQYNLFDGLDGEDEVISVKSSDNIIRYNTIRNSYGGIVARHGNRNSFYGNFIIGDGQMPGLSGFRIYGSDHKIYNNYMEGLTDRVIRLDGGSHDGGADGSTNPTVRWGSPEQVAVLDSLSTEARTELLRGHWRQYNVQIYNNTIVNIGNQTTAFSLGGRTYQPVGTKIYNNLVFSNAGTIFNETNAVQNAPTIERPVYAGNLVEGIAGLTNNNNLSQGFEKKALKLVRSADGLIRLSAYSPAIDGAKTPYIPTDDMDGQIRYGTADVGAHEYNAGIAVTRRPLTVADVGPKAQVTPPSVDEGTAGLSQLELQVSGASITPEFNTDITHYSVTVGAGINSLTIVPTAIEQDSIITIIVDGQQRQTVVSGQSSTSLTIAAEGSYVLIEVALPSGVNRSYTIAVKRKVVNGGGGSGGNPVPTPTSTPIPTPTPIPTSTPTTPVQLNFKDTGGHWAEESIVKAVELGIANGYLDDTFRPNEQVTRLQFAVLLARALNLTAPASSLIFTDQADIPAWATNEIAAAVQLGILEGYGDNTFRPDRAINRAEMVVMLMRAYGHHDENTTLADFNDIADIPKWAQSSVSEAVRLGFIAGREHNLFMPQETATRAEAITVLIRMLK